MISFFLDQHGCAKNQVDGELLIARLESKGLEQADSPDTAQIIIVNSCGFIESAKKESLDSVMRARMSYPAAKILLAGCLAERYAAVFKDELPEADAIFGNGDLSQLDKVIDELLEGKRPITVPPQTGVYSRERSKLLGYPGSAYVKITEGCDNCCSFCAIPLIRGKLRSRSSEDIIEEIQSLLAKNIVEINLVGQDIAAYGMDKKNPHAAADWPSPPFPPLCGEVSDRIISPLAGLLKQISAIKGHFWLRLLYIHPDHFPSDIIPIIKQDNRILPYFDIPFQSGDDTVIRAMNRTGNSSGYISLVSHIRQELPNAVLRTTFLTGFPGESDEQAERTAQFLTTVEPDWSGCFSYSREDDTPAASMKKQVPRRIASRRADKLMELQSGITARRLDRYIGTEQTVLIEELIDGDEGIAIGRCWFQAPEVDGTVVIRFEKDEEAACAAVRPGLFVSARIMGSDGTNLDGLFIAAL